MAVDYPFLSPNNFRRQVLFFLSFSLSFSLYFFLSQLSIILLFVIDSHYMFQLAIE